MYSKPLPPSLEEKWPATMPSSRTPSGRKSTSGASAPSWAGPPSPYHQNVSLPTTASWGLPSPSRSAKAAPSPKPAAPAFGAVSDMPPEVNGFAPPQTIVTDPRGLPVTSSPGAPTIRSA